MDFDFIVVGGGSSGCVLANRLSEDPNNRVLLLEAGGQDKGLLFHWPAGFARMTKGVASWGWWTVPQKNIKKREIWFTQAKVMGGGSSINAQLYTHGSRHDYDAWVNDHGCEGWGYADVLPYFKRAEGHEHIRNDYHNTEGPLGVSAPKGALPICHAFIQAAQEYGLPYNSDFNGMHQAGVGFYQLTQRNVRRASTSEAYLYPIQNRHNLTILTQAQVTRINVDNGRAQSVVYTCGKETKIAKANREVLLTSGAIGSPWLLMLSGIGPAEHLRTVSIDIVHDLPGVGSNLHDHIDLCTISECRGPYSYDGLERWDRSVLAALQYLMFKTGPVTSSLFETGGFWYADKSARSPDMQFHFGQGSGIEKGIAQINGAGVTLNSAFLRPRSRGHVRLAKATPSVAPLIDPNYWDDPYDWEMSLKGLAMAREILSQPALKTFIRQEVLPGASITSKEDLFDYACRMAKTDHHPVGTCKMGYDEMAVVTPDLKIRGIDGLRVCDASVMPTITSCNTNAPTIMIGEKASDLILGKSPLPRAVFTH